MQSPYLIGESVYLRPLEEDDAVVSHGWLNSPEIRRGLASRVRPHTTASAREYIRNLDPEHDQVFAIVTRGDGIYVGNCGLHDIDPVNRVAGLGLLIGHKDHWGRGFGTEAVTLVCVHAFDTLNLRKVWLRCHATNDRGLRLYRRVGFEVEGRLREHAYVEGRYVDELLLGLLRDELRAIG
ncbi:MAG TPA: GNAT family N-acetyltransferase [Candidatus Binatia bacterium]|nr:GNAT family N-acetyltransferase [Candidatus Binatia bacterium]